VIEDVLLAVQQLVGLRRDGRRDARVRMSGVGDPDPGRVVQVPITVPGDEPRSFAAIDVEVRDPPPHGRDDAVIRERIGGH
jgi:hypothetical protein